MIKSFQTDKGKVNVLTKESLINLHELLSKNTHLLEKMDPVEPKGVKNINLLESAINRQLTGYGDYYKYSDCFSNCATLLYGVIKNHSFHNGNKRVGLLGLIKHLYINGYVLDPKMSSKELYEFLIAIADSSLQNFGLKNKKRYPFIRSKKEKKNNPDWDVDTQVRFMAFWIKKNAKPKKNTFKGEVKLSHLKKMLDNKQIILEQSGSNVEVYIEEENKFLGIPLGTKKTNRKQYSIGNNRTSIEKTTLNKLRKDFKLTKADGVDDTFFYSEDCFLDFEIKTFKGLIYRLSKT